MVKVTSSETVRPRPKYNNEAGRLSEILDRLSKSKDDNHVLHAWWKALRIEEDMHIALGNAMVHRQLVIHWLDVLRMMLGRVIADVQHLIPDHAEQYTSHLGELFDLFAMEDFTREWRVYKPHLAAAAITQLQFCAKDLPKEDYIPFDETTALYGQVEALKKAVKQSKLDPTLKRWLADLADEMQRALDEYEICGGRSFEKAWSQLVGNLYLRQKELGAVVEQEPDIARESFSIIDRIGDFAKRSKINTGVVFLLLTLATGSVEHIGAKFADGILESATALLSHETKDGPMTSGPVTGELQVGDFSEDSGDETPLVR